MFNLFSTPSEELDSKIRKLEDALNRAQPLFSGRGSKSEWDDVFNLAAEIAADFKTVRYQSRAERDIAWQRFFNIRSKAFDIRKNQNHDHSKRHYKELMSEVGACRYSATGDFLVGEILTLGLMKTTAEEMKQMGRALNKACQHFKEVKHEMTGEHKTAVHQWILEVRQTHDTFWGKYKSYQQEQNQIYEQKKKNWQEKQQKSQEAKTRIEQNIENNREKLSKAQDALRRIERARDNLKDKIDESHSDNWKSKAEGWLDEMDDKIRDIQSHISRIEGWIQEGKDKLSSWR